MPAGIGASRCLELPNIAPIPSGPWIHGGCSHCGAGAFRTGARGSRCGQGTGTEPFAAAGTRSIPGSAGKSSRRGNGGGLGPCYPRTQRLMPTSPFACRTACTSPCTSSTASATTSSSQPRPSSSSSTRRTFSRKRSRKSISAFASQITTVSRSVAPPRDPPEPGSRGVPTRAQHHGFGLCWDQVASLEVGAEERADVALERSLGGSKWDKMMFGDCF